MSMTPEGPQQPRRRALIVSLGLALPFSVLRARAPSAAESLNAEDGLAIRGYDTVAYHTEGRPVLGRPEFTRAWNGATCCRR